MDTVTDKTRRLIDRWIQSKGRVHRLKADLNSAECEMDNAANELGKWLVPENAPAPTGLEVGQWFNIWFGSGVLRARMLSGNSTKYQVEWFKEPDGKDRAEYGV